MGKSGLMIMRMKICLCSFLFVGALFLFVSAEEETLKEVASAELEIEEVDLGFLRKAINFLWQNRVGYQHVWPVSFKHLKNLEKSRSLISWFWVSFDFI